MRILEKCETFENHAFAWLSSPNSYEILSGGIPMECRRFVF